MPSFSSVSTPAAMVSQSDFDPITMPTSGSMRAVLLQVMLEVLYGGAAGDVGRERKLVPISARAIRHCFRACLQDSQVQFNRSSDRECCGITHFSLELGYHHLFHLPQLSKWET